MRLAVALEYRGRHLSGTTLDLFTFPYDLIPGTDPPQYMAPFTALTDRVLPPIQEPMITAASPPFATPGRSGSGVQTNRFYR